jgi:hypothetical protein
MFAAEPWLDGTLPSTHATAPNITLSPTNTQRPSRMSLIRCSSSTSSRVVLNDVRYPEAAFEPRISVKS